MMTPRLYDIAQVDVGSLINMHQAGRRQRLSEIAFQREEARHQREEEQYQAGLKKQAALASLIPQVLGGGSSGSAGGGTLSKMYLGSQGNNTGAAGSATGQPAPQTGTPTSGHSTLNRSALAQLYALDPEAGKQAYELFTSMDDQQREQAKEQYDTLAAVAQSVKGLPYEQRRAALGQMVPQLQAMGISAEMVQGFDPTDTAIDGFTAQVLGVKGVLEQQNSDRTYNLDVEKFGETKKHNRVTEGVSQGQLTVAQARERREAARQGSGQGHIMETPDGPMLVDRRTGDARPVTVNGQPLSGQAAQKRAQGAGRVLGLLNQAEELLGDATGSYGGALWDQGARVFGVSTDGSQAIAQLRALEGALLAEMPRMEGPQSDRDVQMYRQAAGHLGDPTIPEADKRAAIATIRNIQQRYAGGGTQPSFNGVGQVPPMLRDRGGAAGSNTRPQQVQSLYDEFGLED